MGSAAVLRVASWPLSTLEALQLTHFRTLPDQLDDEVFSAVYTGALSGQRATLSELTTTPAFDRALTLANPIVAQRWRKAGGRAPTGRSRDRRLEATVIRFLCRAAGRATPNGAWSGITGVEDGLPGCGSGGQAFSWTDLISVSPAPARWWAAPSLIPFDALCEFLGRQRQYLHDGLFELEPTLHRRDGGWFMWGAQGWRPLPGHRLVEALVGWFEGNEPHSNQLPLAPLVKAVTDPDTEGPLWDALAQLREAGVLRPAARLDPTSGPPGQILRTIAGALPVAARAPWITAVDQLEELSQEIAGRFGELTGPALAGLLDQGAAILGGLWRELGAPGEPPWPCVRVDAGAPFRVQWSAAARSEIAHALDELIALWQADGTPERYRRHASSIFGSGSVIDALYSGTDPALPRDLGLGPPTVLTADSRLPTRAGIFATHFGIDRDFLVEDRWSGLRESRQGKKREVAVSPADLEGPWSCDSDVAPLCGAQLLSWQDGRLHLGWGRPQPGLFFGRHWSLRAGMQVQAEIDQAFALAGLDVVDVVAREVANLDASIRRCTRAPLDLRHRHRIRTMRVIDGPAGIPLLAGQDDTRPIVPVCNSAAAPARRDPLSLLITHLGCAHGWEFMSFGVPLLPSDLRPGAVSPRIVTESGHLISARRMVATSAWVQQVLLVTPASRFRAWIRLLNDADLGDFVRVQAGSSAPLAVPACSPLAVEALFSSLRGDPMPLLIEELRPSGVVRDDLGREYVAELAIAWWRT